MQALDRLSRLTFADMMGRAFLIVTIGFFLTRYIAPYWNFSFTSGDVVFYVRYAAAAAHAIAKWQIPLTYANDGDYALQPSFLYYSSLFPTLAGLLMLAFGLSAFKAVLLASGAFCISGGLGIYKVSRDLALNRFSSAISCLVFLSSPYLITDMFARAALTELSLLGTLPWWLYFTVRSRRMSFLGAAIALTAVFTFIILAHKIFAVWTLLFGFLFLLLSHGKKFEPIVLQVVGLAGGLIVTLPMWANAVVLLPHLAISNMDMSNTLNFIGAARNDFFDGPPNSIGISWSFINADLSALFPFPYVHQFSTTHDLHLQVGIAVAAAFLLSIMYRREKQTSALQILVATSIALAASVFHLLPFWRFMPQPLTIIQIPFRLLVFATVFGSLLVGSIMQRLSADRRVGLYGFMLVCLIAHLFVFNYRPNVGPRPEVAFGNATLVSHDYQELDGKPSTRALVQASFSTTERWPGNCLVGSVTASADGGVKFPIAYGRRLAVTLDDVQSQIFASNDAHLVVEMSEGEHRATVCRSEPIPVIPYYVAMLVLASVGCGIIVWRRRRELRSKSVSSGLEAPQPGQIGYP